MNSVVWTGQKMAEQKVDYWAYPQAVRKDDLKAGWKGDVKAVMLGEPSQQKWNGIEQLPTRHRSRAYKCSTF